MDMIKIGGFLQNLRKENGMTQEQLAEQLGVARRTVSRWENGNNMPDLNILIELSDLYGVDLREILNGERNSEKMNEETKEIVLQAVDYTNTETERHNRRIRLLLMSGMIFWLTASLIKHTSLADNHALFLMSEFFEGAGIGMALCGILFTSRYGQRIKAFKDRIIKANERKQ
jgi:transcriptional regulator with XRE-family HTH domain